MAASRSAIGKESAWVRPWLRPGPSDAPRGEGGSRPTVALVKVKMDARAESARPPPLGKARSASAGTNVLRSIMAVKASEDSKLRYRIGLPFENPRTNRWSVVMPTVSIPRVRSWVSVCVVTSKGPSPVATIGALKTTGLSPTVT
jgi:hypothetical protein